MVATSLYRGPYDRARESVEKNLPDISHCYYGTGMPVHFQNNNNKIKINDAIIILASTWIYMSSNPRPGFAPFSTRSLYKSLPASILRFPVSVIAPPLSRLSLFLFLSSTSLPPPFLFSSFLPSLSSLISYPACFPRPLFSFNVDSFRSFAHSPAQ